MSIQCGAMCLNEIRIKGAERDLPSTGLAVFACDPAELIQAGIRNYNLSATGNPDQVCHPILMAKC